MAKVVSIQVIQLLEMVGNKAFGFGLTYYPESNGADGVIRVEGNDAKPEWRPTGPFNSKGKGVEIKHIEVKRGNIILNNSHVYDRAGFIAVEAPIINDPVETDIEGVPWDQVHAAALAHKQRVFG